jgi:hypothetical protein
MKNIFRRPDSDKLAIIPSDLIEIKLDNGTVVKKHYYNITADGCVGVYSPEHVNKPNLMDFVEYYPVVEVKIRKMSD